MFFLVAGHEHALKAQLTHGVVVADHEHGVGAPVPVRAVLQRLHVLEEDPQLLARQLRVLTREARLAHRRAAQLPNSISARKFVLRSVGPEAMPTPVVSTPAYFWSW